MKKLFCLIVPLLLLFGSCSELELLFEFDVTDEAGNNYVIKHGFLRL